MARGGINAEHKAPFAQFGEVLPRTYQMPTSVQLAPAAAAGAGNVARVLADRHVHNKTASDHRGRCLALF
ncbi:hypothetical protein WMY93_031173 [Mugilogobius chulae]|uniref:Uncharacterized protein n=1 Tax=Mugilogobius chulae TaxID=88201 RepID=A0AAW0MIM4_9GOBI